MSRRSKIALLTSATAMIAIGLSQLTWADPTDSRSGSGHETSAAAGGSSVDQDIKSDVDTRTDADEIKRGRESPNGLKGTDRDHGKDPAEDRKEEHKERAGDRDGDRDK